MTEETLNGNRSIRLIIPTLVGGGAERVCVRLANTWANGGKQVELCLLRHNGVFLSSLDSDIRVHSLEAKRTRTALFKLWLHLRRKPSVPALAFGFEIGVGLGLLRRMGLLRNVPLIYREGSSPCHNVPHSARWRYARIIDKLDGVIAQSDFAVSSLRELRVLRPSITVIPNPVDGSAGIETTFDNPSLGKLNLLSIGRLSPEKGFLRLVQSFPLIRSRWPDARLRIVGEGLLRNQLLDEIARHDLQSKVEVLEFSSKLGPHFAWSDVYVLPSAYEGQPNAMLEALLNGCRVVGAGGEGVFELFNNLALPGCWMKGANFGAELSHAIKAALDLSPAAWVGASRKLRELTNPEQVAAAYFDFCKQVRAFKTHLREGEAPAEP